MQSETGQAAAAKAKAGIKLSIRQKIFGGFGVILAITAVSGGVSFLTFEDTADKIHDYTETANDVAAIAQLEQQIVKFRGHVDRYVLTSKPAEAQRARKLSKTVRSDLAELQHAGLPPEKAAARRALNESFNAYMAEFDAVDEAVAERARLTGETMPADADTGLKAIDKLRGRLFAAGAVAIDLGQSAESDLLSSLYRANSVLRTDTPDSRDRADAAFASLDGTLAKLAEVDLGARSSAQLASLTSAVADYRDAYRRALELDGRLREQVDVTMAGLADRAIADARQIAGKAQAYEQQLEADTLSAIAGTETMVGAAVLGAVLIGAGVAWGIGRGISGPVRAMTETMQRLAAGDIGAEAKVGRRGDEIGRMGDALVDLRKAVVQAYVVNRMVDEMPINVMMCDAEDFRITYCNKATRQTVTKLQHLLPVGPDQMVGETIDVFHENPGHQHAILRDPDNLPWHSKISLGEETLDLKVEAIRDQAGRYVGPMLTWDVITRQVKLAENFENQVMGGRRGVFGCV